MKRFLSETSDAAQSVYQAIRRTYIVVRWSIVADGAGSACVERGLTRVSLGGPHRHAQWDRVHGSAENGQSVGPRGQSVPLTVRRAPARSASLIPRRVRRVCCRLQRSVVYSIPRQQPARSSSSADAAGLVLRSDRSWGTANASHEQLTTVMLDTHTLSKDATVNSRLLLMLVLLLPHHVDACTC